MLKSVKSESSTSLKVKYQFMDPFGVLGTAYLELHEASNLPASLTAVYENNDGQYNDYWGTFDSRNRVSLSTYEDSYTFNGLKPGTVYYVALAHMTQIGDATERTLDDYYKISTITPRNSLSVSTVKSNSVEFVLQLESLNSGAKKVQLDGDEGAFYPLTSDDIKTAVSRGLSGVISVDRIEGLKKIVLKVVDEEGNVLLTTRCNNSFYKEPTSGTPGGAPGSTSTPVITTPSAPGTSTGTSTGSTGGTTTDGTNSGNTNTGSTGTGGTNSGNTNTGSTDETTTGGTTAAPGGASASETSAPGGTPGATPAAPAELE